MACNKCTRIHLGRQPRAVLVTQATKLYIHIQIYCYRFVPIEPARIFLFSYHVHMVDKEDQWSHTIVVAINNVFRIMVTSRGCHDNDFGDSAYTAIKKLSTEDRRQVCNHNIIGGICHGRNLNRGQSNTRSPTLSPSQSNPVTNSFRPEYLLLYN